MFELVAPVNEISIGEYIVEQAVVAYIRDAAKATGVGFDYLLAKAYQESGFSSYALADTSSAVGMFQFTEETWLAEFRKHGKKYGYGHLAEQIKITRRGYTYVMDKSVKKTILDLRLDPKVASIMAAEYAKGNKAYLKSVTTREITSSDLYMAHFLGPKATAVLIKAEENKDLNKMPAAKLFPDAARANRSVFYKGKNKPYTVGELRNIIENMFLRSVKRFSSLPKEILASLPEVSLQHYTDTELVAPMDVVDIKAQSIDAEGYALDDYDVFSNYAYFDYDDFNDYAEGYDIDYKDLASADDGISRSSARTVP